MTTPALRPVTVAVLASALAFAGLMSGGWRLAEAHAALVRSSPATQAQLSSAPSSIDLWFSEPLEPKFSTFEVLAPDGSAVPIAGIRVDPADSTHLSGLPEKLAPGLYTVAYRNVSTQDGHEWSGTFAFTVLNPDGSVPSGIAFAPELGGRQTSPERVMGRWLGFTGWSLVLGSALLLLITLRTSRPEPIVRRASDVVARGLTFAALPLLMVSGALELVAQVSALDASVLDILSGTRFGTIWLVRQLALLTLAMCTLVAFLAALRRRHRILLGAQGAAVAAAAAGLASLSLMSHAAAAPGFGWAVIVDFLHLVLAATWVGGLLAIATLLMRLRIYRSGKQWASGRSALILGVVGPFSLFAAAALFVLSVTGILRSFGELPTLGAVIGTDYGRWLLIKLALIVPLLGIARMNRRALQRAARSAHQAELATQRLTRMLPIEALLGIGVLAVVAMLGQVPTARGSVPPPPTSVTQSYTNIQTAEDLNIHLQVSPASVGANELRVHVYPIEGGTVSGVQGVFFTFATTGRLGGERVAATSSGGGLYTANGDFLSLANTWDIRVDVRRAVGDVTVSFPVPIRPSSAAEGKSAWASPAPQLTMMTLGGFLLIAAGTAATLGAPLLRRNLRARSVIAGGMVAFAGLWFVSSGGTTGAGSAGNPIPLTEQSIKLGATLYAANCATCHGMTGRGDGPAAAALRPRPADLVSHVPLHPENDTYLFVANGFPSSSMPAWKDQLTEEEIWHLVNFLREGMQR